MLSSGKYIFRVSPVACTFDLKKSGRLFMVFSAGLKTSASLCKTDELLRQAKFLKKLMTGSRKNWPSLGNLEKPNSPLSEVKQKSNPRRAVVLNSLLIRYISDLMSSGEISHEFIGRGIEITRVKVSNDISRATIYWYCGKTENSAEIAALLDKHSGLLRSQLCNLHLMGQIPYLVFVKDIYQERVLDLERLLAQADYGPDFQRSPSQVLNSSGSDPEEKNKSEHLKKDEERIVVMGELSSSKLRVDIYDLDRSAMLRKVEEGLRRYRISSQIDGDDRRGSRRHQPELQLSSKSTLDRMAEFIKQQKRLKSQLKSQSTDHPNDADGDPMKEYYKWDVTAEKDEEDDYMDDIEHNMDDRQYEK